jgi:hypothetical protein
MRFGFMVVKLELKKRRKYNPTCSAFGSLVKQGQRR